MEPPPVPPNCPSCVLWAKEFKNRIEGMLEPVWDAKRQTWGGLADLGGRVSSVLVEIPRQAICRFANVHVNVIF